MKGDFYRHLLLFSFFFFLSLLLDDEESEHHVRYIQLTPQYRIAIRAIRKVSGTCPNSSTPREGRAPEWGSCVSAVVFIHRDSSAFICLFLSLSLTLSLSLCLSVCLAKIDEVPCGAT